MKYGIQRIYTDLDNGFTDDEIIVMGLDEDEAKKSLNKIVFKSNLEWVKDCERLLVEDEVIHEDDI